MNRVLVVAHDAGGAEVVSSWVKNRGDSEFTFFLTGPAVSIFHRKLGDIEVCGGSGTDLLVSAADSVLTGTGYGSDLPKLAISSALSQGIHVVSYLDHWTNYRSRFEWNGKLLLPNEIWVGDPHAHQLASKTFRDTKVRLVPNEYLRDMRRDIMAMRQEPREGREIHILFVAEPMCAAAAAHFGNPNHWGTTEFYVLEKYLSYTQGLTQPYHLTIRPHPAEPDGKYGALISDRVSVSERPRRPLAEDIAWADWVVGWDSMAMAVAVEAGRSVFSCIPKGGPPLALPYPEIVQIFDESDVGHSVRCGSL